MARFIVSLFVPIYFRRGPCWLKIALEKKKYEQKLEQKEKQRLSKKQQEIASLKMEQDEEVQSLKAQMGLKKKHFQNAIGSKWFQNLNFKHLRTTNPSNLQHFTTFCGPPCPLAGLSSCMLAIPSVSGK